MPRMARVVVPGLPHHITQRGNYQQNIFSDDRDRKVYLKWLNKYSKQYKLKLLVYCLMTNHVHFISIPEEADSLARTFNTVHMRYAQYFNKKINAKGHLWHGRFFSCVLDESHLLAAGRYIERNPVRARMVSKPCLWDWSSAQFNSGLLESSDLIIEPITRYIDMEEERWNEYINQEDDTNFIKEIKQHTASGRPFGSSDFISKLENMMGMKLRTRSRGRPKKGKV